VAAVEHLSQGLYRYGLEPPDSSTFVLRLPVPHNPSPEPVTYEGLRAVLATFVDDLGKADATLADLDAGEVRIPVDLARVRYDANGDGTAGDDELLIAILDRMVGGGLLPEAGTGAGDVSFVVGFDRADAYWLEGYAQAMMALTQFWLGYDFSQTFDLTFHRFFPASPFTFRDATATHDPDSYFDSYEIADAITLIHTINWPVADPERIRDSLAHLKRMIALSRLDWQAIEAETDSDREWIPGPHQIGVLPNMVVTEEQVAAWRAVLDETEAALDGKMLVGHWRMREGFNLRRVFEEPRPFDLVLWIAGPAALPYLEEGPVMQASDWTQTLRAFGGAFPLYLFWFN
jgi:hypothetical protein